MNKEELVPIVLLSMLGVVLFIMVMMFIRYLTIVLFNIDKKIITFLRNKGLDTLDGEKKHE